LLQKPYIILALIGVYYIWLLYRLGRLPPDEQ